MSYRPAVADPTAEIEAAVSDAIDALLDGAPSALDTLNELAAAINDDEDFAATVTTALDGKASTSHTHDVLANIATARILGRTTAGSGDSEELTASDVRTLLSLVVGTDVQAQSAILAALVANGSPTVTGLALLIAANAGAARTTLGLVPGTDVEAHDTDLTTIAGLTPSNDDLLQRKAGAWTNRTIAQLLTDLGLGSIYQPLDSDLTTLAGLTATTDSFLQAKGSAWSARTIAQVKTDLGIVDAGWTVVSDQTLGSNTSPISATLTGYRLFDCYLWGRSAGSGVADEAITLQFNGDSTAAHYMWEGGTVGTDGITMTSATSLRVGILPGSQTNTNRQGLIHFQITSLASHFTHVQSRSSGQLSNGTTTNGGLQYLNHGTWQDTAAPTSMTLSAVSNIASGSRLLVLGRA